MNDDMLQGKWKQVKGNIKEKWGKLTEDEIDRIDGKAENLIGKIQEKYGKTKEAAREELNNFLK